MFTYLYVGAINMKANLNQVADDVKSLSRIFRAVNNLADTVDEIGNLESYKAEAEKNLATARLDLQGANAQLDDVKKQVAEQNAKLKTLKDTVAEKITEAELEADRVIQAANGKAKIIVANAEAENKRLVDAINNRNSELKELGASRDLILMNIESANEKLAKIKAQATKLFED